MSFTPLSLNQTLTLRTEELSKHNIDVHGNSNLLCYKDSIFSSVYHNPVKISSGEGYYYSEPTWTVTRILKSDVDLPINKPVIWNWEKVSALRIRADGVSDRPDQSQYQFVTQSLGNGAYRITKMYR